MDYPDTTRKPKNKNSLIYFLFCRIINKPTNPNMIILIDIPTMLDAEGSSGFGADILVILTYCMPEVFTGSISLPT